MFTTKEDRRGVDCAFSIIPKLFELTNSKLVPYVYINDTVHKTRGFLIASGNIAGEKMHFIVNHWLESCRVLRCVNAQGSKLERSRLTVKGKTPQPKLLSWGI